MQTSDFTTNTLFDLHHTLAAQYLAQFEFPWQALKGLSAFLTSLAKTLGDDYEEIPGGVFVHKTAKIAPTAFLAGPCVIGAGTEVRHGAFVRGSVLVGEGCVVGNSVELKNAVLFDKVQVPHFNYVGDSILGYKSHMGAGAITSNVKSDRSPVAVKCGNERLETGLKKCGAMLGDYVEIGCNSVLNPGTVIGRNTSVYPLSSLRGAYPADSIVKDGGRVAPKQ